MENIHVGEVVGLFKFSHTGREVFCKEFKKIKDGGNEFEVAQWPDVNGLTSVKTLKLDEALLGDFLEYLSTNSNLSIEILECKGQWAEIDHWGDLQITEERIKDGKLQLG